SATRMGRSPGMATSRGRVVGAAAAGRTNSKGGRVSAAPRASGLLGCGARVEGRCASCSGAGSRRKLAQVPTASATKAAARRPARVPWLSARARESKAKRRLRTLASAPGGGRPRAGLAAQLHAGRDDLHLERRTVGILVRKARAFGLQVLHVRWLDARGRDLALETGARPGRILGHEERVVLERHAAARSRIARL